MHVTSEQSRGSVEHYSGFRINKNGILNTESLSCWGLVININNGLIICLCVWQVSEAIKTGARVMKEIKISPDEVHEYLEEIEETIQSQKEVEKALGEWCFCFVSFD